MRRKFAGALGAYGVLAVVAVWLLSEPKLRAAVLVLLVGLAVKTGIAEIQHQKSAKNDGNDGPE